MSQEGLLNVIQAGGNAVFQITPDIGGAVTPVLGNINLNGAPGVITSKNGAGNILINAQGLLQLNQVTITSQEIKNLANVPKVLVPAPGLGKIISFYGLVYKYNFGGTGIFTNTAALDISYLSGVTFTSLATNIGIGVLDQAFDQYEFNYNISSNTTFPPSNIENAAIVLNNTFPNFTGNALNDNSITFAATYVVLTL